MKKFLPLLLLLAGCQSALDKDGYAYDPYENVNRKIYGFNDALDRNLLKPVAKGYDTVMPQFAQNRVEDFFGNLDDVNSLGNSMLQFKGEQSLRVLARIINNTFFGLLGLFDVATPLGNGKIEADFGQTLAHYGVPSGPYVVLPLLGPSTPRDSLGRATDTVISPKSLIFPGWAARISAFSLEKLQARVNLLGKEGLLDSSPDPYATMRDAWLQHRWGQLGERVEATVPAPEPDEDDGGAAHGAAQ